MPPTRKTTDKYANVLYDSVTESAANTLTFESVDVGLNMFDKVGLLIHRIEYFKFHAYLNAGTDAIEFGLSSSNGWTSVDASEPSIISFNLMRVNDHGTAGNAIIQENPLVRDFSDMPGGGILITPKPLYLFVEGANLASPAIVQMRMYFTVIPMKPEEYFELLEARQYFG